MSELQVQHEAHKARQARLGMLSRPPILPDHIRYAPAKKNPKIVPHPHNYYWSHMWFWDLVNPKPSRSIGYQTTMQRIIRVVSRHYGVSELDIISERRTADIVLPRQVAMYLARHYTTLSYPQIGHAFGKRDHTTVLHAANRIKMYTERSPAMGSTLEKLMGEISQT